MVAEAKERGMKKCMVPWKNAGEAALVSDMQVFAVKNLADAVNILNGNGGNYCESTQGWDDAQNISMSLNDYYNVSQVFDPPGTLNWFQLEGAAKDMLVTIANLRSIFGEEDPEVEYISIYKGIRSLSLSHAQRLAECEMSGW